jgi:hypothetical protein
MKLFIACLAALVLLFAPAATACPPVDPDGGGSFSYGSGYGADACAAPMVAGNFGGYGGYGGAMVAAPSYGVQSFAAPSYGAAVVRQHIVAAPAYSYSGFSGRRFGGGFRGGYGVVAAPVVRQRIVAAPVYGYGTVVTAPVVAVPVRAPGPIRGAFQGFRAGLRNRLNGF